MTRLLPILMLPLAMLATTGFTTYPWTGSKDARLGHVADLGEVIAQPVEVTEDSRCPADVDCVSPGRVRVRITYLNPKWPEDTELELVAGEPRRVKGGAILIEAVRPERRLNQRIAMGEYRFDFRFDADR
ncbi:hypothetical protein [Sphingopyxis sp. KK2]|uniref:hypothetical protein n=1 Tax=Sphingopyxis sp. KK2 TaxID=1855727 RepID=UPI00097E61CF|nr:hypothetical protein [Sphingopyxis sp. KK2]